MDEELVKVGYWSGARPYIPLDRMPPEVFDGTATVTYPVIADPSFIAYFTRPTGILRAN